MSVSASEVNGSSGCYSVRGCLVFKVLHLVPVVLAVLVDRSKFSFFFVVFVVILVICRVSGCVAPLPCRPKLYRPIEVVSPQLTYNK